MSSLKPILCNVVVLALFAVSIALQEEKSNSTEPLVEEGPKGNCSCGGFPTSTPNEIQQPLLSQMPGLVVKCDEEGNNTCKNLCTALATATKAKGPELLCNRLKDCNELKLSAFYKICDGAWVYANMTAEEPLCCVDAAVRACASQANGTLHIDANTPM